MKVIGWKGAAVIAAMLAAATVVADDDRGSDNGGRTGRKARNVIFFIGDGMGVSTITAARVFSVGVAGQLVVDQFPYTALS